MTTATTATASSDTDSIERSIVLNASRSRLQGQFTIKGHEHCMFDIVVERVEPEQLLSYRWHPYSMDTKIDYEKEQRTVVTFTLKDAGDGTLFTVLETGFDNVPPERRLEAFRMNTRGWEGQMGSLQRHVTTQ